MCLPQFKLDGVLPEGIYEATLDEIKERFCSIGNVKKREQLFNTFKKYLGCVMLHSVSKEIIMDGSFVTNKTEPNDIDIAVFCDYEYNNENWLCLMNDEYVRKNFTGLQVLPGFLDSWGRQMTLDFMSDITGKPNCKKGLVKVVL